MKTFYYSNGVKRGETLTIKELREGLAKYPDDMPVMAEWEGHYVPVKMGCEGIVYEGNGDEIEALILDADDTY